MRDCSLDWILKENDILDSWSLVQDPLELGQQLVTGDHSLHLSLVDAVHSGVLAQVGVESHHGEGLFEAGL